MKLTKEQKDAQIEQIMKAISYIRNANAEVERMRLFMYDDKERRGEAVVIHDEFLLNNERTKARLRRLAHDILGDESEEPNG